MIRRKSKPQQQPTAIDGIVTAIAPVLIIGMIASLVFFLVIAFYRGDYDARLMYILGLFTVATVLIATIAIEDGRAYANAFGIPLAIAAGLAMFKFVTVSGPLGPFSSVINIGLLGVAWYLADRITFDCTAVDERDAGVQKGLLQSLRLIEDAQPAQNAAAKQPKSTQAGSTEKKRRKRKHNPGVWVLYFALLALPLFGIGQLVIPDPSARANAFKYLVAYLACTLGLLLTTSFVAMRRYVRHRGIEMPSELNRLWLGTGAIGIAAILLVCLLLPLPSNRGPWLSSLPLEFVAPNGLNPSQWGWGKEGQSQQPSPSQPQAQQPKANAVSDEKSADANGSPEPGGKGEPQASDNAPENAKQQGSTPENKSSTDPELQSSSRNNSESQPSKKGEQQSKSDNPSSGPEQSRDSKQPNNNQPDNNDRSSEKAKPRDQNANANNDSEDKASAEDNSERQPPNNEGGERPTDESKQSEKPDNNTNNKSQSSDQPAPQQPPQQAPSSSANWLNNLSFDGFSTLLKWITIVVLIAIIFFYIVTHPNEIAKLWRDLQAFFANLFGRASDTQAVAPKSVAAEQNSLQRKSFASFVDPFSSGNTKLTPRQVIEHTFSALEAWAFENGRPRVNAQTAEEFATQLARQQPQVGPHARTAAQMLDRVMFASWNPTPRDIAPLAKLWQMMRQVSRA